MNTNKAAQKLGRLGGIARALKLSKEQRQESARKAGLASAAKRKERKMKYTNDEKVLIRLKRELEERAAVPPPSQT